MKNRSAALARARIPTLFTGPANAADTIGELNAEGGLFGNRFWPMDELNAGRIGECLAV